MIICILPLRLRSIMKSWVIAAVLGLLTIFAHPSEAATNASLGSGDQNAANQVRVMQHDSVDRQLARLTQRAQGGECACWINSCTSKRKGREQQAALACDQCKFNLNATQQDSVLKRSSNLQFVRSHDSLEVMVS